MKRVLLVGLVLQSTILSAQLGGNGNGEDPDCPPNIWCHPSPTTTGVTPDPAPDADGFTRAADALGKELYEFKNLKDIYLSGFGNPHLKGWTTPAKSMKKFKRRMMVKGVKVHFQGSYP